LSAWPKSITCFRRAIREEVLSGCAQQSTEESSNVAQDDEGDPIYSIDQVSEALLIEHLERGAGELGLREARYDRGDGW